MFTKQTLPMSRFQFLLPLPELLDMRSSIASNILFNLMIRSSLADLTAFRIRFLPDQISQNENTIIKPNCKI